MTPPKYLCLRALNSPFLTIPYLAHRTALNGRRFVMNLVVPDIPRASRSGFFIQVLRQ